MQCSSCGEELLPSSTKCPYCGFVCKSSRRRTGVLSLSDFTILERGITVKVGVVESESIRNAKRPAGRICAVKARRAAGNRHCHAVWQKDITPSRDVDDTDRRQVSR